MNVLQIYYPIIALESCCVSKSAMKRQKSCTELFSRFLGKSVYEKEWETERGQNMCNHLLAPVEQISYSSWHHCVLSEVYLQWETLRSDSLPDVYLSSPLIDLVSNRNASWMIECMCVCVCVCVRAHYKQNEVTAEQTASSDVPLAVICGPLAYAAVCYRTVTAPYIIEREMG